MMFGSGGGKRADLQLLHLQLSPSGLVLALSLLLGSGLQLFVLACPSDCTCKWKGGKQTVECVNRGLRTFPGPIDPGTQVLDLSGNSFETLPPDHFMRLSLINLQKIYLSRCRLSHINSRAFRGLTNLVDLDLSNNVLREVPTTAFPDTPGLMRLILSGNPISHLGRNAFSSLEALTNLEISHAGIELIEKGAFEGLLSLEWLRLDGNKLRRVQGLGSLPPSLKGVWLEENPWDCDCQLLELRLWLGERKVANSMEPRCTSPPRLTNFTLRELNVENFACTPQLSPTTMYQKIGEGKNVSLMCKVTSIPESTLEWWFNGQPVANSSLNVFVETSSGSSNGAYPWGSPWSSAPSLQPGPTPSSITMSTSPTPGPGGGTGTGVERKSELVILNATVEENGTFLCVARNPAGLAMANFTLRVLSSIEPESYVENVHSFVNSYPNLFLIALSTLAVIGVVIIVCLFSVVLCKCCHWVRRGGGPGSRRPRAEGTQVPGRLKSDPSFISSGKDGGNSLSGNSGSGGGGGSKLSRHLSETSTLTTHTKSNGSVFLLSTSSELGDSNPDLIEGVGGHGGKRIEADGVETLHGGGGNNSRGPGRLSNGALNSEGQASGGGGTNVNVNPSSELPDSFLYPVDYGLPKTVSLNVGTLLRRSPSYPLNPPSLTLPPTYDLAKYPKEYINPTPVQTYMYSSGLGGGGPPILYTTEYGHGPYPTAYLLPHPSGPYTVYGTGPPQEYMSLGYLEPGPPPGPGPGNCSCTPIMESPEETEEGIEPQTSRLKPSTSNLQQQQPPTGISVSSHQAPVPKGILIHQVQNPVSSSQGTNTPNPNSLSTSSGDPLTGSIIESGSGTSSSYSSGLSSTSTSTSSQTSCSKAGSSTGGGVTVKARLQRQLTTQINESPDEGYEDESAEGTEI